MPSDRTATLHAALNATLRDEANRSRLLVEGVEVEPSESPEAYGRFLVEDRERWADVVRRANIRAG
jgi:tripartite-type tricarboxylate transporter receptor subunit TctC